MVGRVFVGVVRVLIVLFRMSLLLVRDGCDILIKVY